MTTRTRRRIGIGPTAGLALAIAGCASSEPPVEPSGFTIDLWQHEEVDRTGPGGEVAATLQATLLDVWRTTNAPARPPAEKRARIESLLRPWLDGEALAAGALGPRATRFDARQLAAFRDAYVDHLLELLLGRFARHPEHPVEIHASRHDPEHERIAVLARGSGPALGLLGAGVARPPPDERVRLQMLLRSRSGAWRIAALQLDRVDVGRNFRDQFESVLRHEAPAALIRELEAHNRALAERDLFGE